MTRPLLIESLNCNGLGDKRKRKRILNHFSKRNVDIVLLQETFTTPTTAAAYRAQWKSLSWKHTSIWNPLCSRSCGVAILIGDATKTKIINYAQDDAGRILTIQFKYLNTTYQIQSIYAPTVPQSRPLFYNSLENYVFPDGQLIAGGDFNMVEDPHIDRAGGTPTSNHTKGLTELNLFKTAFGLTDMWRDYFPQQRAYSWSSDTKDIHSRLDRFYLPASLKKEFLQQHLYANPWSDHRTVSLTIDVKAPVKRGQGWFKLNTALLEEDEYRDLIREFLRDWIKILPTWSCIQQWWVEGKNRIRTITLDYSYQQSRLRKQKIAALTKFLDTENKKPNPDKQFIADTQENIAYLRLTQKRGTMVRSREETIVQGEKPSRYFFAQERIKKAKSTITEVYQETINNDNPEDSYDEIIQDIYNPFNQSLTSTNDGILTAIKDYYTDLFSKQDLDTTIQEEFLDNIDIKLPTATKTMMDADITDIELNIAIHLFNKDKTPGIDGLPIEFYLCFWDQLRQFFPRLINDIYINGLLPSIQQRLSVITLVHKKGDQADLDNWRPISLLCVDLKILEKVLSLRLKKALPHIIGEEQTCGIEGRTIFQNLYTVRDTITYANDHKIPAYIISLDFQKAFDKVDHDFLAKTLTAFGFGSRYVNYVATSNSDSQAIVANNGFFTPKITLGRGIKQGGQQSGQQYDIIGEVLAIAIRKCTGISGIHLPGKPNQLKLTLYADDNNTILSSTQSIIKLFELLERFRKASGCNINVAKTQGLTIGGASIPDLPFPVHWNPEGGVKILGVYFHNTFEKTQKTTWEHIKINIENRAESLTTRKLSFYGKRILINLLLLSKAWHVATVIPSTKQTSTQINTTVFNFLFTHKKLQTPSQDILKLNFHHGGIAVLDFDLQQKSLRINRLRHILDQQQNSTWLTLPRLYLGDEILRRNNEWMFLASPTIPKIHYADPTIRYFNINIPFYLREFLDFLRDYKHRFLLIKNPSTHLIYQMFLKNKWATTRINSEYYWNSVVNRTLPWKDIWTVTYKSLHRAKYLDTYYWFLTNSLPSGHTRSTTRQPYAQHCKRCHRFETTFHMFAECPFARNVWNKYYSIYAALLEEPNLNYTEILFSTCLPKQKHTRLLLITLTTIIVHELWRSRCAQQKQDIPTSCNRSIITINARIKSIHFAYYNTAPDYANRLCLPSPICKVQDGKLTFNLPTAESEIAYTDSEFTSDEFLSQSDSNSNLST